MDYLAKKQIRKKLIGSKFGPNFLSPIFEIKSYFSLAIRGSAYEIISSLAVVLIKFNTFINS